MRPINRQSGTTETERYLAKLADTTFLDLWSYPNTYIDKRSAPGATGKELADLLVVCGDDIIIFSDKSISWPQGDDVHLSWARWYRRAIQHSVDQIRGAERWIRKQPQRIFLDAQCTEKLPLELPTEPRRRIHGVAIATGATKACSDFCSDPDGSLMIMSHLKGGAHVDVAADGYVPFSIGDVDPNGPFVHVFDQAALNLVMRELDTVTDFVRYLNQRAIALRSGSIHHALSEADLIAFYLQSTNADGEHYFPTASNLGADASYSLSVAQGEHQAFVSSAEYKSRSNANKPSYIWDKLIRVFTEHIISGSSVEIAGEKPDVNRAEPALRYMAREPRIMRRALGSAFAGALRQAESEGMDRFARVILPSVGAADKQTGYVFLILAYPSKFELEGGYKQYREGRVGLLETYCSAVLHDNRKFKRMIGIGVDASSRVTGREGGSEDLVAIEIAEWSPELEQQIQDRRRTLEVLLPASMRFGHYSTVEYPAAQPEKLSRQQRRAQARRARKESGS